MLDHAQAVNDGTEYRVPMESEYLIEFRYADGRIVIGDYAQYARQLLTKGDQLEYDGMSWVMYDREDRGGVTIHLFRLAGTSGNAAEASRARSRGRAGTANAH
jgi:hypothetical protein